MLQSLSGVLSSNPSFTSPNVSVESQVGPKPRVSGRHWLFYTGASSPSLLSSLLSALWAAGHVQASADAASSIIASASQVRIFHLGLSLQRLAKYNVAASALAS